MLVAMRFPLVCLLAVCLPLAAQVPALIPLPRELAARADPLPENPFIDCRSTYLNHMDPFEVVSTFLFQQSFRRPHGDARALGGILCATGNGCSPSFRWATPPACAIAPT